VNPRNSLKTRGNTPANFFSPYPPDGTPPGSKTARKKDPGFWGFLPPLTRKTCAPGPKGAIPAPRTPWEFTGPFESGPGIPSSRPFWGPKGAPKGRNPAAPPPGNSNKPPGKIKGILVGKRGPTALKSPKNPRSRKPLPRTSKWSPPERRRPGFKTPPKHLGLPGAL